MSLNVKTASGYEQLAGNNAVNVSSNDVKYNNTTSSLKSETVKDAIDELNNKIVPKSLTEYQGLPEATKTNGTLYMIKREG